jgi:SNF2 family DNA or RNA helicase
MVPLKTKSKDWQFDLFGKKEWSYPIAELPDVLDALEPFLDTFTLSPDIDALTTQTRQQRELEAQQRELEDALQELTRQTALEIVEPYLNAPISNGQRLYPHQKEAVRTLIKQRRAILAHDMGLGKTRTALIAAKGYDMPVIVIAPSSLRINWLREAEAVELPIEIWSWAKLPEPFDINYVLIADEAHYAQTLGTKRTTGFLALAENARAVFCLSGTPIKNGRPINLYPLLLACQHPLSDDLSKYERKYCDAYYKPIGRKQVYDVSGASNLDDLHKKTKDIILHKKKEECLKDLPPKIRVMRQAEVSKQAEKAYNQTLNQLRTEHQERVDLKKEERIQALREEFGDGLDDILVQDELDAIEEDDENARALVELGMLRHAGSIAKVESAIELANEVLDQEESIVIFVAYRDSGTQIAQALGADFLTGDSSTEERQAMIDRFQQKHTHALVCMIGAGGVGITLTAAQTVVLVDRPWTPGDAMQCEDRLHRIGQLGSVTAIWLQYGAIDEKVDTLLQQKQERISLVLEGKRKTMRGIRSVRSLAKDILASIRSGKPLVIEEEPEEVEGTDVWMPVVESTLVDPVGTQEIQPDPVSTQSNTKRDKRLKGEKKRVRVNMMLDEEVIAFLRQMKTSNQNTTTESGYSGFIEQLVRNTPEFQAHKKSE